MEPTITEQQAADRAENYVEDVTSLMQPRPRLEIQSSLTQECTQPSDGGPLGRVSVSRVYWLRDVSPSAFPGLFAAAERYWSAPTWRVLEDQSDRKPDPTIWVENSQTGFRMRLETSLDGQQLALGAVSPCVWPNGTPEPRSSMNG